MRNSEKNSCAANTDEKEIVHVGWVAMGKKIRAIAFYYPSPEFNFKNILTQVFAHQKYHAQLKGEEKIIAPENCTPSPPLPP